MRLQSRHRCFLFINQNLIFFFSEQHSYEWGLELTNIKKHTGAVIQARGASCSYGGIRGGRQCEGAEYSEELHLVVVVEMGGRR